ncbi:MAG: 50S ribosomal protein L29 [Phycisphaeraceae bacterium]
MKADEVHKMSDEEMVEELTRLRRHRYDLKSQTVTEKLEDPTQLTKTRRDIARILTEQQARRLAKQAEVNA